MRNYKTIRIIPVFIFLILFLYTLSACSQSQSMVFSGTIEAAQIEVQSEINGKIISFPLIEGSLIAVNDILASADASAAALQVKQAEAGVKAARAKLDELRAGSRAEQLIQAEAAAKGAKARLDELKSGSRSEQVTQAEGVYKQAQDAAATAQKNYDYRLKNLDNLKQLKESGGVSQQLVDDAQNLLDAASLSLANSKEQQGIAKAQLDLLKSGATTEVIRAAEANYEQTLAQWELLKKGSTAQAIEAAEGNLEQLQAGLDLAKLQLEKYNIKSPAKGILLTKNADIGQMVSQGTNVATIQTQDDYWIKIYVPQKHHNSISVGQAVNITSPSIPGESIEGTVIFKSPKAEFTPKNVETTEAKEENTVFAVKIKLTSHLDKLSAGATANVYVK